MSNAKLISSLLARGVIRSPEVLAAFQSIDRAHYTSGGLPYADTPQPIPHHATISAPHMHAMALEALLPKLLQPGCRFLDVGSGTGILLALAAHLLASRGGRAVGVGGLVGRVSMCWRQEGRACAPKQTAPHPTPRSYSEHIPGLVDLGNSNLDTDPVAAAYVQSGVIRNMLGDGRLGPPPESTVQQFDAIHVGASSPFVPPALLAALAPGGHLVMPLGGHDGFSTQSFTAIDKARDGSLSRKDLAAVAYVPLTSRERQEGHATP